MTGYLDPVFNKRTGFCVLMDKMNTVMCPIPCTDLGSSYTDCIKRDLPIVIGDICNNCNNIFVNRARFSYIRHVINGRHCDIYRLYIYCSQKKTSEKNVLTCGLYLILYTDRRY